MKSPIKLVNVNGDKQFNLPLPWSPHYSVRDTLQTLLHAIQNWYILGGENIFLYYFVDRIQCTCIASMATKWYSQRVITKQVIKFTNTNLGIALNANKREHGHSLRRSAQTHDFTYFHFDSLLCLQRVEKEDQNSNWSVCERGTAARRSLTHTRQKLDFEVTAADVVTIGNGIGSHQGHGYDAPPTEQWFKMFIFFRMQFSLQDWIINSDIIDRSGVTKINLLIERLLSVPMHAGIPVRSVRFLDS